MVRGVEVQEWVPVEGHSDAVEGNIVVGMAIELFLLFLDKRLVELKRAISMISRVSTTSAHFATYNASRPPEDLAGGRVANKDQMSLLNTIMDILRRVLMQHASVRLPIVEWQSAARALFWVEPCSVGEKTRTSKRVTADLEEVDEDAE